MQMSKSSDKALSPGPSLASSAVASTFSGNPSKNSGDTTPEIQVHPLSSETMGDGDNANTTIVHTKINPPPPKPPDRTYQSIAGAYGRTRDETPWQTAPDSIDTRAATRAGTGLTQYNPKVVATGKEGTQPPGGQGGPENIQNDQPGLEFKQMMDQIQKLQLELDENRSRMAMMKKEHEAEIIRAYRAYTESLEQMQGKAEDSGYYPQSHAASALPVGNPTTMQPGTATLMQNRTNIDRSIPQPLGEPTHNMPHESGDHEFQQSFPSYEPPQPQPPNNQKGNDLTTIFRMMMTSKSPSMNVSPFDGTYEFFDEWYQEFHSKIHTNILLTKYDKLLLLEKETSGPARTIVTTCGRQENSYELAITKLKETYQGSDNKLQKLYNCIKQTTPLTHGSQSKYTKFADDVQIFVNHIIQQHNEKLITDTHRYCDEILYRLPQEEIIEMEEHRKKCLETHSDINMGYAQFLGALVTHTQRVAAEHRQRHKITRSLGISRDCSTDKQQVDKQSLLSNRSNHSKPERAQRQSESGQDQTRRGMENYSSSSSRDSSPMTGTDYSSESYNSTRTALLAAKKDHKPKRRRSTSSRTGRSTSVNTAKRHSRTGTPEPRRKEKHPRGLSAERETQQQSKNDRNKSANKRRMYNPGVKVTRLTAEEIEAQRPIISPAKPKTSPETPPKAALTALISHSGQKRTDSPSLFN